MKKIVSVILLLTFLVVGCASAYLINFNAPSSVESGSVLFITGTSSLPAGFTTEVVFYKKAQVGNNEVAKIPFTIQNEGRWNVNVDTTGWAAGEYTLSIPRNSEYSYGSSSNLLKAFTVTADPSQTAATTPVSYTVQPTQIQPTPDNTYYPAKTPSPTSTPVALWIFPAGFVLALLLIKIRSASKE